MYSLRMTAERRRTWTIFALSVVLFIAGVQAVSAQTPVRILPLGDSITQGVNDINPPGGYPGYRERLWNELTTAGFNVDFVGSLADGPASIDRNHEGHGGFRIDQIIAGIDGYLAAASPDIILLHIGTNDLLQDLTVDLATQRLAQLLDRIHQVRPTAHVIVASIIPVRVPNAFDADPEDFAEFASHIAGLVGDRAALGRKISHVDMATLVGMTQSEWDSFGIHPNDAAYERMANVWFQQVATVLDGDAPPTVGATAPFDLSTVSGVTTLSANAFDDFGVTAVEFAIDGVTVFEDLFAPYQTSWNSTTISNGPHTLRVTARDAIGQTRVQLVRIRVVNPLTNPALVAAFGFEEASGPTAFDGSGRGNNASLIGVTRTSQGHTGRAMQFSGSSGRLEIGAPAADLRFTTAFTVSAWVNPAALPSGWHIIAARQRGAGSADGWLLAHNGTTLHFGAGGAVTTTLTVGQWTHVAAVKNGTTVALYKNGVLVASSTAATSPLLTDANEVAIGAGNNGNPLWGEFFKGRVDDLRFYAEARTLSQIADDMNIPVGVVPDTIPPVISSVSAAAATDTATITWTTDEPGSSQVEYGPTSSYGSTTPLDAALMTSHSVTLTGLSANTVYHYRVRSRDANLNEATSGDHTFMTTSGAPTLVAAYGFEETSGTTAVDSAGNDNPGTLLNGVARTAGRYGLGLTLDGVNDRVTVASAGALNPGTGPFTVGVWVRTSGTTVQRIVGKRSVCTGGTSFWNLQVLPSGVAAAEVNDVSNNYLGLTGARLINDGQWHYVTMVRNNLTMQVYVDGILDVSGTSSVPIDVTNTAQMEIGTLCNGSPFNGMLDEVRYYSGALSPSQIQEAMATGVVSGTPGSTLVAAYNFDAGSGPTAADQSGQGNTLLLTNTTWATQGHTNGALQFNGTSSRAELPVPAVNFGFTTAFTISLWVNPTTLPTGWHMIAARQLGTGASDSWFLAHNGTSLRFSAGGGVATTVTAGQWTHVAAVKNGTTVALYKNGVLAASLSTATSPLATDANEVGIGAGNNGNPLWQEFFHGRIDDLRFYSEARTPSQIAGDMSTAVGAVSDTVPPVISDVSAAAATDTATITWTTDEPGSSQVEYGPTSSYGSTTPLDAALMTSHSVTLTGLSANTVYHYRVRSRDANLNEATSGDHTFMTTSGAPTLVAAYGFEETSGTTAVDSAGNDNPGTLLNGVARTAGRYGLGLTLDGVNDRVTVASAGALNPGTGPFTVGVWVRTSGTTVQRIVGKRSVCTGGTSFWNLQVLPSGVAAAEVNDVSNNYLGLTGARLINDGQWHYVTMVRNNLTMQVYVDGILDVSGTSSVPIDVTNTAQMEIGTLCNGSPFNGMLDEVRYYSGALSPSQIQEAMATGVVSGTPGSTLVAAYNFDAGSGPTAADQSGQGNTLLLTNTTWATQGHTNGALQFNGTSSRAELPVPAVNFGFTTAFTISLWVNPTTLPTGWHMIAARQLGTGASDSWFLAHNGTSLRFSAGGGVATTVTAGQWTHVAAVKNGTTVALYKNGVLAASLSTATSPLATDANEVGIGAGNNGNPLWQEFFHGRIDDLRFYSEGRSLEQVQDDLATPVG